MSNDPSMVEMISDGEDLFVAVNGVKVAKRGRPGTPQANTWVSLGPGWTVLDRNYPQGIEVMFEGARISLIERSDKMNESCRRNSIPTISAIR
jgi:hypothetical protein